MNLLMLTKYYPYGTGEAFIENEVNVLSEYFEKIVIIACEVPKEETRIRRVPDNCIVHRMNAGSRKLDAAKGVKYLVSGCPDFQEEIRECTGWKQKLFLGYFEEKSRRVFRDMCEKHCLDDIAGAPFVLYSYWLFMTARVGTLIMEQYRPVFAFSRAHRYDLYEERNSTGYLPYRNLLLSRYDRIFPCSEDGTDYLIRKYPRYADRICTALLGTLEHGLGPTGTDGVFRICSCSRIAAEKRVGRIIDALKLLEGKNYRIEWTHIGGGQELPAIRKRAERELSAITAIFPGDMPNADVMKYYQENPTDLFLNVSSSEGLPVSIMEAISFGIPVVATDVGGTKEIVIDNVTGRLIGEHYNDGELAGILEGFYLARETGELDACRKRCREFWEAHFQAIPNYHALCRQVLSELQRTAE